MCTSVVAPCQGEFTGSAVVVRGAAIDELHAWASGGFGELIEDPAADASSRRLQLSTVEAYFLSFEQRRLALCRAPQLAPRQVCAAADASSSSAAASADTGAAQRGGRHNEPHHGHSEAEWWEAFCEAGAAFPHRYAVYRALREAGWVVRTGVKYGTDFTLYAPHAAPTAHALLTALVASATEPAERSWCWLQQHVRLCHGVSKGAGPVRAPARVALRSTAATRCVWANMALARAARRCVALLGGAAARCRR